MKFLKRFWSIFFHGTSSTRNSECWRLDTNAHHAPEHERYLSGGSCIAGIFFAGFMSMLSTPLAFMFTGILTMDMSPWTWATIGTIWLITTPLWLVFFCWRRITTSWHYAKKGWTA